MSKGERIRSRRGRGAVLWTALTVLALNGGLVCWARLRAPFADDMDFQLRYSSYQSRRTATRTANRQTIAFVGSSRFEWGIRARIVEETLANRFEEPPLVHNFGFAGAGPLLNWAVCRRLAETPAAPDLAIVEINPVYFGSRNGVPLEMERLATEKLFPSERRRLVDFGWPHRDPWPSWNDFEPRWRRDRAEHFARVHVAERRPRKSVVQTTRCDEWGDNSGLVLPEDLVEEKRARYRTIAKDQYFDALQIFKVHPIALAATDALVALCRAKGTRVAFILMPEADEFRDWYTAKTHTSLDGLIRHLRDELAVPVYDARTWFPPVSEYLDSHHLLEAGAGQLSRRIADEWLAPLLRDESPDAAGPFRTTSFPRR